MKAIILAAGKSRRMGSLTTSIPKPLLPIGNSTLIENVLKGFAASDIEQVIIVTGYLGDLIKKNIGNQYQGKSIVYVKNHNFDHPSNTHSLLAVKEKINSGMVFANADSILEPTLYSEVIGDTRSNLILTDGSGQNLDDLDPVKVLVNDAGHITKIGKKLSESSVNGIAVGVYKFSQKAANDFFKAAMIIVENETEKEGFLLPVREVIKTHKVEPFYVGSKYWYDVDTPEEYNELTKVKKINNT